MFHVEQWENRQKVPLGKISKLWGRSTWNSEQMEEMLHMEQRKSRRECSTWNKGRVDKKCQLE